MGGSQSRSGRGCEEIKDFLNSDGVSHVSRRTERSLRSLLANCTKLVTVRYTRAIRPYSQAVPYGALPRVTRGQIPVRSAYRCTVRLLSCPYLHLIYLNISRNDSDVRLKSWSSVVSVRTVVAYTRLVLGDTVGHVLTCWPGCENWCFHSDEDSSRRVLGCEDGGTMDLRNSGILPQHYTVSQPRWPQLKFWLCEVTPSFEGGGNFLLHARLQGLNWKAFERNSSWHVIVIGFQSFINHDSFC
jgi:hypothetical protein